MIKKIKNFNWKLLGGSLIIPVFAAILYTIFNSKNLFEVSDYLFSATSLPALAITCAALYRIEEVRKQVQAELDLEGESQRFESRAKQYFWRDYQNNLAKTIKDLESDIQKFYGQKELGKEGNADMIVLNSRKCHHSVIKYKHLEFILDNAEEMQREIKGRPQTIRLGYRKNNFDQFKETINSIDTNKILDIKDSGVTVNYNYLDNLAKEINDFKIFCESNLERIRPEAESYGLNSSSEEIENVELSAEEYDGVKEV